MVRLNLLTLSASRMSRRLTELPSRTRYAFEMYRLHGVPQKDIAKELGDTRLSTQVFNAGPAAIEALNAGAIDATYIGLDFPAHQVCWEVAQSRKRRGRQSFLIASGPMDGQYSPFIVFLLRQDRNDF